jgi:hypothetical protein
VPKTLWFNASLYFVLSYFATLMIETTHWNRDSMNSMNETCLALQDMNVKVGRIETTKI